MSISIQLLDPRTDPEPPDWVDFQRQQQLYPMWSYDLLQIASWSSWAPVLLGLIRRSGQVVGAVAAMCWRPGRRRAYAPPGRFPSPCVIDVWLVGSSGRPSWVFSDDIDVTDQPELLRAFERAALSHLGLGCVGVVYRNVPTASVPVVSGRGRVVKPVGGNALAVLPASFEDWLHSLRPTRRRGLRKHGASLDADPDIVIEYPAGGVDLDGPALAQLLNKHNQNFAVRMDPRPPVSAAYLAEFLRHPDVRTITYRDRNSRLLAFGSLIDHAQTPAVGWWAKLDLDQGGRPDLFFDHFMRHVSYVISQGRRELSAGRGHLDVKATLGFAEVPLCVIVVPRWAAGWGTHG